MRTLIAVLFLICLASGAALAQQSRYISDELALDLRSGPGNQYRIQQMVPAGTRVEVLEEQSGWTRVRMTTGMEGWVLSRLLTNEPSARSRLEQMERDLTQTRARNEELTTALEQARARVDSLESNLSEATTERDRLDSDLEQASQGLELYDENQELRKQVIDLQREIQDLSHESERLRARNDQQWFMVGSLVLGAGILFGLIIPRIRWRRQRSSWGSSSL
ncbi:MAG: TIGR04211 family SH3 domain-containing protein [Aquisalimonadaceae bacterium]